MPFLPPNEQRQSTDNHRPLWDIVCIVKFKSSVLASVLEMWTLADV